MDELKLKRIQKILSRKTVGIAGAGGLGSNVAVALARSGIGCLIVVDFDKVEKSNLNRQYYFLNQIGKYKVDALQEVIHTINPAVKVEKIQLKLQKGKMHDPFKNADVIVEALDKAETKADFIEDIIEKFPHTPLVAASGVAGYGHSDRIVTRHLNELHVCYDEQAKSSEQDVLLAPKVCLMANWQANIVLDLLIGEQV